MSLPFRYQHTFYISSFSILPRGKGNQLIVYKFLVAIFTLEFTDPLFTFKYVVPSSAPLFAFLPNKAPSVFPTIYFIISWLFHRCFIAFLLLLIYHFKALNTKARRRASQQNPQTHHTHSSTRCHPAHHYPHSRRSRLPYHL